MPDPTLVVVYLFTSFAVAIMSFRLILRIRTRDPNSHPSPLTSFQLGDYLTLLAIACALLRLALIHVVLIWGSNKITPSYRLTHEFTPQEIYRREMGSKFTIVNRFFYNSYLWLQKFVLLDLYRRLIHGLWWEKWTLRSFVLVFAASFVAVQVVTFTECTPFDRYWKVFPDPGKCVEAKIQLIVLGALNILTDLMLLVLPIPLVLAVHRPLLQKLQLVLLFSLGIFIIAITLVRLPQNVQHISKQMNRTTWASAELLAAAIVANGPTLWSLTRKWRRITTLSQNSGYDADADGVGDPSRTDPGTRRSKESRIRDAEAKREYASITTINTMTMARHDTGDDGAAGNIRGFDFGLQALKRPESSYDCEKLPASSSESLDLDDDLLTRGKGTSTSDILSERESNGSTDIEGQSIKGTPF